MEKIIKTAYEIGEFRQHLDRVNQWFDNKIEFEDFIKPIDEYIKVGEIISSVNVDMVWTMYKYLGNYTFEIWKDDKPNDDVYNLNGDTPLHIAHDREMANKTIDIVWKTTKI